MLPFTTYSIPESAANKTALTGKWLFFIVDKSLSPVENELLQKISSALKADFASETVCITLDSGQKSSSTSLFSTTTRLVISMGIPPAHLGLWVDLHHPGIRFMENMSLILTSTISELEKNPNAKKELWKNMQMFMAMKEE